MYKRYRGLGNYPMCAIKAAPSLVKAVLFNYYMREKRWLPDVWYDSDRKLHEIVVNLKLYPH